MMFEAVPDYYYSDGGHIILNEANICSISHVLSDEKQLKRQVCWHVKMSNGESWIIKRSKRLQELMPISDK